MTMITTLEDTEITTKIENAPNEVTENAVKTLCDSELLFVGGGSGTVIF